MMCTDHTRPPNTWGEPGDRRIGVIWHTQGSGKSLTMVFYAGRIIRHPAMENSTLVVLTDRNDLEGLRTFQFFALLCLMERLEAKLWEAANALRGAMDAAEYKHVVLGLVFLKYISDAFEAHHAKLEAERDQGADPEDPDEYRAEGIFWVPAEARWSNLQKNARQPTIGQLVDDAMAAVERDNPSLRGVLPKDYARPGLDKQRLGQLIDLVSNIHLGDGDNHARDILGRVYEYFLNMKSWGGERLREDKRWRFGVPLAFVMYRPFWRKD